MVFGLTGAPNTFQQAMTLTLAPLLRKCVIVFFDDILVFSPCGGINPYTLTAKLGPARIDGSGPSERRRAAQPTWLESCARS